MRFVLRVPCAIRSSSFQEGNRTRPIFFPFLNPFSCHLMCSDESTWLPLLLRHLAFQVFYIYPNTLPGVLVSKNQYLLTIVSWTDQARPWSFLSPLPSLLNYSFPTKGPLSPPFRDTHRAERPVQKRTPRPLTPGLFIISSPFPLLCSFLLSRSPCALDPRSQAFRRMSRLEIF